MGHIQLAVLIRDDLYRDELFGSLVRLKNKDDNFSFVSVPGKYPYKRRNHRWGISSDTNEFM